MPNLTLLTTLVGDRDVRLQAMWDDVMSNNRFGHSSKSTVLNAKM